MTELRDEKPKAVLKWAYRHYALEVDRFDTVEGALRAAIGASDVGAEALVFVEVFYEDGANVVLDADAAWELARPIQAENDREYRETIASLPLLRFGLEVQGPNQKWAHEGSFVEEADARTAAQPFIDLLGHGRVRTKRLGRGADE